MKIRQNSAGFIHTVSIREGNAHEDILFARVVILVGGRRDEMTHFRNSPLRISRDVSQDTTPRVHGATSILNRQQSCQREANARRSVHLRLIERARARATRGPGRGEKKKK